MTTYQKSDIFELGDWLNNAERKQFDFTGIGGDRNVKAIKSDEFRTPKEDEWYLSGAIPVAYRAKNNLTGTNKYRIMKLVKVEKK